MFDFLKKLLGPAERSKEDSELDLLVSQQPELISQAVQQHLSASDTAVLLLSLPPETSTTFFKSLSEERRLEMEEAVRELGPLTSETRKATLARIMTVLRGEL